MTKLEAIGEIIKIYSETLGKIERTTFDSKAKELAKEALEKASKLAEEATKEANYCGAV